MKWYTKKRNNCFNGYHFTYVDFTIHQKNNGLIVAIHWTTFYFYFKFRSHKETEYCIWPINRSIIGREI